MPLPPLVLNALRHLIGSHPCRVLPVSGAMGAQRLTASDRQSPSAVGALYWNFPVLNALRHLIGSHMFPVTLTEFPTVSAQRLTASDRQSRFRQSSDVVRFVPVLNALRHLIGSHNSQDFDDAASAACAQRLTASDRQSPLSRLTGLWRYGCSTPYGI